MANLNPEKHDNVFNPYTLQEEKQEEIIKVINDDRLTNPPGDYFRLKLANETIDIPKLARVSVKKRRRDGGKYRHY
jgi:hypothetical protein